jgi:hypothetical protein
MLVDRNSAVDVLRARRSGGSNPGGDEIFRSSRPAVTAACKMGTESSSREQSVRRWLPTLFCTEVKERLDLYPYSFSGPSWPVLGCRYLFIDKLYFIITFKFMNM